MKIQRSRHEDITASLSQRILRFHDPFVSKLRQELDYLNLVNHSPQDPPIIFSNSNLYSDPPAPLLAEIFQNPNALLIITGPIRSDALQELWTKGTYNNSQLEVQCTIFGRDEFARDPPFCLHADYHQALDVIHHLRPQNLCLFHGTLNYLTGFKETFTERFAPHFPTTEIKILQSNAEFLLHKVDEKDSND